VAVAIAVALNWALADWDQGTAVVAAYGVLVAVLAGAVGGMVAGVVAGAAGWALYWALVADRSTEALIALPAWLAAGAVVGWLAVRARRAASRRDDELRSATEQVREAEIRYRSLTEILPVVTYVRALDPGSAPIVVGGQIETLTGYTADEWLRERYLFMRLVVDDDRERVQAELASAADRGGPLRSRYRLRARDGRVVSVQDEAVVVLDAEGRPLCVQGWLLDVSDRERVDEERRQLRAAEAAATAAALDRRTKTDILAKAAELLASSRESGATIVEVASLTVRELVDWCIVDRLEEDGTLSRVVAARAEGSAIREPEPDVAAVITRRGPHITESEMVVPLMSSGGRMLGALTLVAGGQRAPFDAADLSWASALAALAAMAIDNALLHDEVEARAEADRVLSYVGDGVFLLDRSGVVRLWNPRAEAITRLSAEHVVGRTVGEAIPHWDQLVHRIPTGPAGSPAAAEAVPLETERGERWISISGVQFFGGTVFAFRDITDAHRLDELQAEFIATASHELRTPLAAVYGAAQTLRRHDFALDEAGRERFISLIVDESERLGRIVNQILLANQLERGRVDLEPEAFDGPDLLERVAEAARTHAPPHITLTVVAGESPPVAADKDHVRQILINLVENAIKYSPDGGSIELGLEMVDHHAVFRVVDEGIGIPEDEQPRVFEKFYRLDPQMTRGIGGTGLGLYICSALVERMGGRIWVESRHGKGSAFSFEIPTTAAAGAPVRPREIPRIARAGS
jgi:PAS domain S-box-containing protein